MDYLFDETSDSGRMTCLAIVDDCSKESVGIEADTSIPGAHVTRVLDRIKDERGLPRAIRIDNVPNAIAAASFGNKHPVGARWRVDGIKKQVLHDPVVFRGASGGLA
jgi:putative transposase